MGSESNFGAISTHTGLKPNKEVSCDQKVAFRPIDRAKAASMWSEVVAVSTRKR